MFVVYHSVLQLTDQIGGGIVLDREGLDSIHGFYHSFGKKKKISLCCSRVFLGVYSDPMSGLRSFLQRHY